MACRRSLYWRGRRVSPRPNLPKFCVWAWTLRRLQIISLLPASYYDLTFVGLAISLLSRGRDKYALLCSYWPYGVVSACVLLRYVSLPVARVMLGGAHIMLDNFLIPVACLVMNPIRKAATVGGWIADRNDFHFRNRYLVSILHFGRLLYSTPWCDRISA